MAETLTFKVEKQEIWKFFELYDALGWKQKKIWQLAVWYFKKFPNAHPSQTEIASHIPGCREHVNRTLKKFERYGWLSQVSMGARRTNRLFIPEYMLNWHLYDRKRLKSPKVTRDVTGSSYIEREKTLATQGFPDAQETIKEMPPDIDRLPISEDCKQRLKCFPLHIREEVVRRAGKLAGKDRFNDWDENRQTLYLMGIAKNVCKERNIYSKKMWIPYYRWLEKQRASA